MLKTLFATPHAAPIFNLCLRALPATSICNRWRSSTVAVEVKGWAKSIRKMKEMVFVDISDGSSVEKLQVTIPKSSFPENVTPGTSLGVKGVLNTMPNGQLELIADEVDVIGECRLADGYPFAPRKSYSNEYLREYLHLRPKTNKFSSILRVRHQATKAFHDFFDGLGYTHIHTPILTSNDCEGAGEVFRVTADSAELTSSMAKAGQSQDEAFFDGKTYLTVSAQLHLEAAAHAVGNVYCLNPTFRAENSRSRLHLSEFYMLEAEQAFVQELSALTQLVEKMIKTVSTKLLDENAADIRRAVLNEPEIPDASGGIETWLSKPFPIIEYTDAVWMVRNRSGTKVDERAGFTKEQELDLVRYCDNVPCFVVNFPKQMKSFYMKEVGANPENVAALDLLVPNVGELVGGSLRENDFDKLQARVPDNLAGKLDWYLELRKFGGVPTAGFGMGFERYLQFLMGVANIKDTIPFPRWPHNCSL